MALQPKKETESLEGSTEREPDLKDCNELSGGASSHLHLEREKSFQLVSARTELRRISLEEESVQEIELQKVSF